VLPPDSLVLDGRFRVIRPIGSGGMGDVYLGEQVSLGRKVAIKVLHHDLHMQHGMLERFKREARLLSAVEHPAVVRIIDFGESGDSACLVMELVEGVSLFDLLQRGPLPPARALTVLHQLSEGLAAIHDKGIIHRDIKPENIYLSPTPRGEQARLLDFGIARLIEPDADSNVSQVGVVLGTPEYLSPEQAIGARVDARTDLYCLGVVAYRMLSGRLPFEGPDARKYIAQHANVAPLPLDQAVPALAGHPGLIALVMRLLEKNPDNRFQNAHALADALSAVASSPLMEALTPPSAPVPREVPPASGGTMAFGEEVPAAPAAEQVPEPKPPPASSGTAAFGGAIAPAPAPAAPPPVAPPTLGGAADLDEPAPGSWDFWNNSDTSVRRGAPPPTEPWDSATGSSTTLFLGKTSGTPRVSSPSTRATVFADGRAADGARLTPVGRRVTLVGESAPVSPPSDGPGSPSPATAAQAGTPQNIPQPTAAEATASSAQDLGSASTQEPVPASEALPQRAAALASHRARRLIGLGLVGGLLLAGGVGIWLWNQSPEVQARRLLEEGKPAEALQRLDAVPAEEQKEPKLGLVRALALHDLKRHGDEHEVLLSLPADNREDLEERLLDGLAEDFGAEESDKALRKLLGSLPKDPLHSHFESLAEGDASPRQWGALRYLEASQETEGLDLVELYSTALASEDCAVRAKAARRLGALGDTDAVPALQKLAEKPKDKQPPGSKNCGQDEAAAALRTLKKPH
jgi:serine/threonine protein kinase